MRWRKLQMTTQVDCLRWLQECVAGRMTNEWPA